MGRPPSVAVAAQVEQHSFVVQILSTTVTRTMFLQGIIDNIATEVSLRMSDGMAHVGVIKPRP